MVVDGFTHSRIKYIRKRGGIINWFIIVDASERSAFVDLKKNERFMVSYKIKGGFIDRFVLIDRINHGQIKKFGQLK